MRAPWRRRLSAAAAALALSGCAAPRAYLSDGVFRAPAMFRIAVPAAPWTVVHATESRLELQHPATRAGILAHAECGDRIGRQDLPVLARRLFVGLAGREVIENGAVTLGGLPAVHAVLETRGTGGDDRMRVEAYVTKSERCVYDLVYVAPPESFAERRDDFRRVVESFARE